MSWPLASFTLVGLVLAVGWLAYERARPSARMVAVVATLAAVAALGRDAFVALPDVKPITAVTLVVGYALGPLPGFSVGAVGMLASNVMLGQGSYTPWQMAAWGLVGLIGAALGRLSGRRLGRVPLAFACAFTALLAKEVMNVYTWTLGATHTPAAFLLVAGGALPFDVTDVVASFLFGLAFAPELARVLARVRSRMHVHWEPARPPAEVAGAGGALPLAVLALGLAGALALPGGSARASTPRMPTGATGSGALRVSIDPAAAATAHLAVAPVPAAAETSAAAAAAAARASVAREIAYLASTQNSDGGWGSAAGQPSSELYSAWVAIGLAAAGRNPQSVRRDGHTVLDALRAQAGTLEGAGDYERTMLALRADGAPVTSLAGKNLLAGLLRYRESDGSFSHQVNLTAFAIFALRAAGHSAGDPAVRAAGAWLARQQDADGGFNFDVRGTSSDVDDTAAALQALADAGIHSGAGVEHAVAFLLRAQNLDGGFPEQPGGESNAQSTSWAVQGLTATGRNVEAIHRSGSRSPLGYLESLLAPNGSVRYSRTSTETPVWVTAQALTALARAPFPIG
jgi:energy-coupling factor transport system substrate-specific component